MQEIKIKSDFGNGSYAYVTDDGKNRNIPKELAVKIIKMQREFFKIPDKTLAYDLNCMNLTEIEKEVIQDHFKKLTQDIEYYMNVKENIIIDKLAKFRLNGH